MTQRKQGQCTDQTQSEEMPVSSDECETNKKCEWTCDLCSNSHDDIINNRMKVEANWAKRA